MSENTDKIERRDVRKVAEALVEVLTTEANEMGGAHYILQTPAADVIGRVARRILGHDRPNGDDDREYYELCDQIANRGLWLLIHHIRLPDV